MDKVFNNNKLIKMSLCFCFVHNYIQLPWSGQSKSKFVQVFLFDDVHKSLFKASTLSKNTELNTLGVVLKMTQNQKKKSELASLFLRIEKINKLWWADCASFQVLQDYSPDC